MKTINTRKETSDISYKDTMYILKDENKLSDICFNILYQHCLVY